MGPSATARHLDRITQTIALIGFAGLVVAAFFIFYDGAARWLGAPRLNGFSDYGEVVYPLVIASCFPAGLLRQTNVTVRFLGKIAGPRVNAALEALAAAIVLAFFVILVWQFVGLAGNYGAAGRTTRTIGIPLAPFWWVTTAIMALCVPVQAYVCAAWTRAAIRGEPAAHQDLAHTGTDTVGEAA